MIPNTSSSLDMRSPLLKQYQNNVPGKGSAGLAYANGASQQQSNLIHVKQGVNIIII